MAAAASGAGSSAPVDPNADQHHDTQDVTDAGHADRGRLIVGRQVDPHRFRRIHRDIDVGLCVEDREVVRRCLVGLARRLDHPSRGQDVHDDDHAQQSLKDGHSIPD